MNRSEFDAEMRKLEEPYDMVAPMDYYTVVRVDGKSFHTYTRNFDGKFDTQLAECFAIGMVKVMKSIPDIAFGYSNSDEVTFIIPVNKMVFSNRVQKLTSLISSIFSVEFNKVSPVEKSAYFDARVMSCSYEDMVDNLKWRQQSGERNAINTLARTYLSKSAMFKKSPNNLEETLRAEGIKYTRPENMFYHGFYYVNKAKSIRVSKGDITEVLETIPELVQEVQHGA